MMFRNDLRFAARSLRARPLFSAVVILSLGLAIGANSTIFSVLNAALFRPVQLRDADRLINIYTTDSAGHFGATSYPDYTYLRANMPGVSGVLGYSGLMATITGGAPEVVFGEIVTGNYFTVSGARIALGREFLPEEDRTPGANPVVVISDRLWRRRFGANPSVIGQSMTLNGHPFTIIGVAAPEVTGLLFRALSTELWAPAMMMAQLRTDQLANRDERWMFVKARLAPGVSLDEVSRGLALAGARLEREYPTSNSGRSFAARRTSDVMINPESDRVVFPAALFVIAAVSLVVLIAATNVGNLMFARAAAREREIAVRLALGASRPQLVRQLLFESFLLSASGGALGLGLAVALARLLAAFHPPVPVPIALDVGIDARVIVFTAALTVLAAVIAGLLPALQASRSSVTAALTGARAAAARRSALLRLRRAFLVPQMALSLVLLIVAGLFTRSVMNAGAVDPGFDIARTSMLALSLNLDGYDSVRARTFYADLTRRLEQNAGISAVTVADRIPLDLYGNQSATIDVEPAPGAARESHTVQSAGVDADYFAALGISLRRGRGFTDAEVRDDAPVAVVSEAMARRFWPNANAVGRTMRYGDRDVTIVGVARDTKVATLGESPQALVYVPLAQNYARLLRVVVRSNEDPDLVVTSVRREVSSLDPAVAVFESRSMTSHLGVMLFPYRAGAAAGAVLGAFGLLLSCIGTFGVVAFGVARRKRELGIRMSLGATSNQVVRMVLAEQARVIGLSIAIGLTLALAAARALASVVFGIGWNDPLTLVVVVSTLAGVALAASYLPAARISQINPASSLRDDG